ncbi:hypothetical protein [Bradyrhizobium lupini]
MGVVKLQFSPRTAAVETDTPDVLAHALAKLRNCGDDAINVLRLTDELPDIVLPYLAWAASRRSDIPTRVVRILMKCCGETFMERALGLHRLRALKARYVSEPFEALH